MEPTQADFAKYAYDYLSDTYEMLKKKGQTYSNEEAFANFTLASLFLGIPREVYLLTLVAKHFLALYQNTKRGRNDIDIDGEQSRIQDIIIYMLLLSFMFTHKKELK